jgi:exopolysaccharide production protein ExoQ
MPSFQSGRAKSSAPIIDTCAIVPILACAYAAIIGPLLSLGSDYTDIQKAEPGLAQRIFWPAIAAVSVVLVLRRYSRLGRPTLPPHIICLFAYLAFAGASVLWAFRPEASFIRFLQQVMVLTSIVLPGIFAVRTADMMRGLFLCVAFAAFLNIFFVLGNPPSLIAGYGGYPGYFLGKNYLGEFSAAAFLLSLHEILHHGLRRVLGTIVLLVAASLLFLSNSKTSFALAVFVPFLAGFTLVARKAMRISPAITLWSIAFCCVVLSKLSGFNMYRLSYMLYGDSTLTGRTIIWDFASWEIDRSPLLGWGYQSFWLVGPDAPSVVDAPGWVKYMPNAHNGYYDTMLELGYIGLVLLVTFITATLHAIGRLAEIDLRRAWLALSLALFVIIYNFLESQWMRGFEFLWIMFVIVAVEIGQYWPALRPDDRSPHKHRFHLPAADLLRNQT